MDDAGVNTTPFGDIVAVILVLKSLGSSTIYFGRPKGNDKN